MLSCSVHSILQSAFVKFSYRSLSQLATLPYEIDRFNAAQIKQCKWSDDVNLVRDQLSSTLDKWLKDKRTSAWLWIPIEKAHVIPIAAEFGFTYHHAEDRMAVLNKWLLPTKSLVPRFATHQVGVAGAVLHPKTNELLIIKERVRKLEFWKLPGGAADLGENIGDGAIREVFEETGIKSKFESIIAMRQTHEHPGAHGRSDLYFICRLTALNDTIDMDYNEILDCKWAPLSEVISIKNPILSRIGEQLLYGLENGFEKTIDLGVEQLPSIVTGKLFDFYLRPMKTEDKIIG